MDENKFAQIIDMYVKNEKLFNAALTAIVDELKSRGVEIKSFDYNGIYLSNGIDIPMNAWETIKGMPQKDSEKVLEETKAVVRMKIADFLKDSNYNL